MIENPDAYFFDTYAYFEIVRGNPKYKKYEDSIAVTTIFNLAELNYGLKKEISKELADDITDRYADHVMDVHNEIIKEAMDLKHRNKNLSIPDAVGYTVAKKLNIKFLTGDDDFKDFDNVEFVRKD